MSAVTFNAWLANSKPGDKYAYHDGFLAKDCTSGWTQGVVDARLAFNDGFVELVQEAVKGGWVYWAQRKAKRSKPSEDLVFGRYWVS